MKTMLVMLAMALNGDDFVGMLIMLIPIVTIVFIYLNKRNETNKRAQVALAALEKSDTVNPEELLKSLNPPKKSTKKMLLNMLRTGIMFTLLGVAAMIAPQVSSRWAIQGGMVFCGVLFLATGIAALAYFFVGRRMLKKEIEAEEKENCKDLQSK